MPKLTLVTPAPADVHNGNTQTARRYARLLAPQHRVDLRTQWRPGDPAGALLLALHARRSAASIAAWPAQRPLLLVLTGTDLYRDLAAGDADTLASLARADALVLLNRLAPQALPPAWRAKARVILQSCPARVGGPRPHRHLRALVVGHLRAEKDPATLFEAVRHLDPQAGIHIDHLGAALDPALGRAALALMREAPHYRWLGARPHGEARARIARANLLVHPSRMEGGAHVLIEALRSGTPVLASRVDGNLGLLGSDWPLLFAPGDAAALASQLQQLRQHPQILEHLAPQVQARAADFEPAHERAALQALVVQLLAGAARGPAS